MAHAEQSAGHQQERFKPLIPFIIGAAMLIQTLNSTVIVNALPTMALALNRSPVEMNVTITIYLLAAAIFLPLSGWMADRYGSRTVFLYAIIIYLVSSILCGISQNLGQLVGSRILAGAAAAMMTPVGRLVLLRSVPRRDLVRAMTYVTMPSLLGPVLGPPIGGFIVTYWSWRWIFLINVPVGLASVILAYKYVPEIISDNPTKLDIRGALLSGTGLALIIFGLQTIGHSTISLALSASITLSGAAILTLYVFHARFAAAPILNFTILRVPTYAAGVIGGQFVRMLNGATPFLLTLLLQIGFGLSALASGLLTFTSAVAALLMKTTARPILQFLGFRSVLIWNTFLIAAIFSSYALFSASTPYAAVVAMLFFGGFFRSLQFTALNTIAYADIPSAALSNGSTLLAMSQPLAQSIGIAIAAGAVQFISAHNGGILTVGTIAPVFVIMGVGSLFSIFFFIPLDRDCGADLSGHRQRD